MKKLSEVCKIVGVTRRTLQEYASSKVDLLQPTKKTESGYWLYDDEAIQRLILIQIFVEAEYERKKIKAILDSNDFDLEDELDKVTEILKGKQQRLEGMINTIESIKMTFRLPISSLIALSNTDVARVYQEKSFLDCFGESVEHASHYTEEDKKDASTYLPMWYLVVAIGCLKDFPAESERVQECVINYLENLLQLGILDEEDMNDDEGKPLPKEVLLYVIALGMDECIDEMIGEPDVEKLLSLQCGEGARDFIKLALHAYCVAHKYIEDKYDLD